MVQTTSKRLVIIDGKSVFYRGYYAMPNLTNKDGLATGGVYGFASMALLIMKRLKPDYVAVAWDKAKTNIRKRRLMFPDYKINRKPAPADFYEQVPLLKDLLKAFGWPLYEFDDYEADDIMGTLSHQVKDLPIETFLVTSDLDMLQLVGPKVHIYVLKTGLSRIEQYSPQSFISKYGINVDQYLDLKALKGDSSDNIPGVAGIGEKTALELLKQFKTLDNIYDNLALIKDSTATKLVSGKKMAYLSKDLARIWLDAPVKFDIQDESISKANKKEIINLLQKYNFKSLINLANEIFDIDLPSHTTDLTFKINLTKTEVINSLDQVPKSISFSGPVSVYIRFSDKNGYCPQIVILADEKIGYVFNVAQIGPEKFKNWLIEQNIFAGIELVGFDLKRIIKLLLYYQIGLPTIKHDILIGSFLINSLIKDQSLTGLANEYLDYNGSSFEVLNDQEFIVRAPEILGLIKAIYQKQIKLLDTTPKIVELMNNFEIPMITILAKMELTGIKLDINYLNDFNEQINDMILELKQTIYGYADQEFNIASPKQLAAILFDTLKLPTVNIKKGKNNYSTDSSQLEKLFDCHPIINFIVQFREVVKLKNTYLDTLPKMVDPDQVLHTTFNLTMTQTGRLSSSDPNLQNIPIRTDLGRKIRTAFVARDGYKLISADYSQFELRIAAVLAKDQQLIGLFNQGGLDVHTATAASIYNVSLSEVTKQMRRTAKAVNFGILYGMSPHGLVRAINISYNEAVDFINKYKDIRRPLFDYMDQIMLQTRRLGYAETMFGRRRAMLDINSSNYILRQAAERAAINMPVQGTESDLMKLAMIKIDDEIKASRRDCHILLQIHDSVLIECAQNETDQYVGVLRDIMENIFSLGVKLEVDIKVGDNWGQL